MSNITIHVDEQALHAQLAEILGARVLEATRNAVRELREEPSMRSTLAATCRAALEDVVRDPQFAVDLRAAMRASIIDAAAKRAARHAVVGQVEIPGIEEVTP